MLSMATSQKVSSSRNSLVNYIGRTPSEISLRTVVRSYLLELPRYRFTATNNALFSAASASSMRSNFPFLQPRTESYTCNLFLRQFPFLVQLFSTSSGIIPLQWPQKWKMGILHFLNCSMFGLFSNSARSIHNFGTEIHPADLGFGEEAISI
jgi:hypothetical protein